MRFQESRSDLELPQATSLPLPHSEACLASLTGEAA